MTMCPSTPFIAPTRAPLLPPSEPGCACSCIVILPLRPLLLSQVSSGLTALPLSGTVFCARHPWSGSPASTDFPLYHCIPPRWRQATYLKLTRPPLAYLLPF
ncbi:hypothetical protein VTI74DRAFT_9684 [Chaetomium olivicolor]